MANLAELSLKYRLFLAGYPWRTIASPSWTPLAKPLESIRLALVTSAGLYHPDRDQPFARVRGGDSSFRWIERDQPIEDLVIGQTSSRFDRTAIEADPNEAFPLDRVRELVNQGSLGSLAERHPSFNGSITAPGRLVRDTAPAVAAALTRDRVDAALLVPV
jgi:D-proline reductase (dithiol) PrdB